MPETASQGWPAAIGRALGIFLYFVVATVWLPDRVLQFFDSSSDFVQDAVVSMVWTLALVAGLIGLRRAQAKGLI